MNGRDKHTLHVERCTSDTLTLDVVAVADQPWFVTESFAQVAANGCPGADERAVMDVIWPDGQKRPTSLANELGLYRVLMHSKNPMADDLARWVFKEVAPAVRKTGRFRVMQEAKRLGVRLDYTDDQWEWLKLNAYLIDVIPLALAGFDSIQITQALNYNTPSGITVRKQLAKLRQLGMLPQNIEPRVKQLESRIAAQRPK